MCTTADPAAPASTGQALAMVRAGLGYLASCDAGSLGTAAQAAALTGLEAAEAQHTAARARSFPRSPPSTAMKPTASTAPPRGCARSPG